MQLINEGLITTQQVEPLCRNGIHLYTLRTDLIHPVVSGNKWFKLKLYLQEAQLQRKKKIVTFGGAFSNHIVATAYACKQMGMPSIGIIRGEQPATYSHTLKDATAYGMELFFISRTDYKKGTIPNELKNPDYYFIPEGGYGELGAAGIATLQYNKKKFDTVCCTIGTGTMMAGIINAKGTDTRVIGISVLKNHLELKQEVANLIFDKNEVINIIHDYHCNGYAKYNKELIQFMNIFYKQTGIPTDFVYSAKLFFALNDLIDKKFFTPGSNILAIHCGGLQGNNSLQKGTLIF